MRTETCPFCNISEDRVTAEDRNVIAIADDFPVANGHTLVIPKEHVRSIFQLDTNESTDLWEFVVKVRQLLADRFKPDGFSIGINDGDAAGQTVSHAHIHIIPRYKGDVEDPRGGLRWIIPDKARYWQ
jgi:diadenosine tetraphosphate (Ap4A) HIT family hydrolase